MVYITKDLNFNNPRNDIVSYEVGGIQRNEYAIFPVLRKLHTGYKFSEKQKALC